MTPGPKYGYLENNFGRYENKASSSEEKMETYKCCSIDKILSLEEAGQQDCCYRTITPLYGYLS